MNTPMSSSPSTNGTTPAEHTTSPVLELAHITAGYGSTTVLRDVTISIPKKTVVALLGPNGAGKTTLLRVAAGLITPTTGTVNLLDEEVTARPPSQRARRGLCLVPEGRGIFPNLTVQENLRLQIPPPDRTTTIDTALDTFPILKQRLSQTAGSLSGGQQQMLALSRCFLANPSVVLLDEVSMGLAPRIIDDIFNAILTLKHQGTALLLVEQYVNRALQIADHIHLLNKGHIEFTGNPQQLDETEIHRQYIGKDPPEESARP
jgi:branched-chain amino acid transport system ATP-binding protein